MSLGVRDTIFGQQVSYGVGAHGANDSGGGGASSYELILNFWATGVDGSLHMRHRNSTDASGTGETATNAGEGVLTTTYSGNIIYLPDYKGMWDIARSGTPPISFGRRERNGHYWPENLVDNPGETLAIEYGANYTLSGTDTVISDAVTTDYVHTARTAAITPGSGKTFIYTSDVWGEGDNVGKTINMVITTATQTEYTVLQITLTDTPVRYSISHTTTTSGEIVAGFDNRTLYGVAACTATQYSTNRRQWEDRTESDNPTIPSEYTAEGRVSSPKHFTVELANTVTSNVVTETAGTVTLSGDRADPWVTLMPTFTNSILYSTEATNARGWYQYNMSASLSSDGMYRFNQATLLTANAANAYTSDASIAATRADHAAVFWLKRVTGTGAVTISAANGIDPKVVYPDSEYRPYTVWGDALNPRCYIKLATSGDQVLVGNINLILYHGQNDSLLADIPPVYTTTTAQTLTSPTYTLENTDHNTTLAAWYLEFKLPDGMGMTEGQNAFSFLDADTATTPIMGVTSGLAGMTASDTVNGLTTSALESGTVGTSGFEGKMGVVYDASSGEIGVIHSGEATPAWVENSGFVQIDDDSGDITIGNNLNHVVYVRNVRRYDISDYDAGKTLIETLVTT